jgi:N-acetylglucosaminyldiphosphoundecaprenol N-acetyl-beta-D-mannosaminyltransferase
MDRALARIDRWIADRDPNYVCFRDVHGVMASQRNPELQAAHENAGMVVPDGMPLVWLSRLAGFPGTGRVCGPDFMPALCRRSAMTGYRHFFYGGAPGVAERLATNLHRQVPDLQLAGTYSPPFRPLTPAEDAEVVRMINEANADIVWVGLSTPKQEKWMMDHVGRVTAPVLLGVGAAFDFHAGTVRRAPAWMQQSGLEWLFRLLSQPRRLWRRYLVLAPAFLFLAAGQILGLKRYPNRR